MTRATFSFLSILAIAAIPACGQTPAAARAPRTADARPNLTGIWQALNAANWDIQTHGAQAGDVAALGAVGAVPPGIGVVEGETLPYLPAAAAKKRDNAAHRWTADPERSEERRVG